MGHKSNPNILRVGLTTNWTSKYFESKPVEQSVYGFIDFEIKKYVYKFFKKNGLVIHSVQLEFNENFLHIYVSYFLSLKAVFLIKRTNKAQKYKAVLRKYKRRKLRFKKRATKILKLTKLYKIYRKVNNFKTVKKFSVKKNKKRTAKVVKTKKLERKDLLEREKIRIQNLWYRSAYFRRKDPSLLKPKRSLFRRLYKKYLPRKNYKTLTYIKKNFFLAKFFEGITLFVGRKYNVFFTLKQLNKNIDESLTENAISFFRKSITRLRKYHRNKFFKEGVNVLYTSIVNRNSASFLAEYIAQELGKLKRHRFFLYFVKSVLSVLYRHKSSDVIGVRITVNGRFNGAPRARKREVSIGKAVPALTIKSDVNYAEAISYTKNGTFGVKIWIFYKPQETPCLRNPKEVGLKKLEKVNYEI